jgi:hypothetical protein
MPIEYIIPIVGGDERDSSLARFLANRITKLEK